MQSREGRPGGDLLHPSREGLGCSLCNQEREVGLAVGGWALGPHLCWVPGPAIAETLPLLSKRPGGGKGGWEVRLLGE